MEQQGGYRGPLAGFLVVDFSHVLAGPFCSMFLADSGANVIKVEPPWGEIARHRGVIRKGPDRTMTSYVAAANRGKRSICLDLKSTGGRDVALQLTNQADIVIENFSPAVMRNLGLALDDMRARNPRLITVSLSLFGAAAEGTSRAGRRGLAIIAEAESGLASLCRDADGNPIPYGLPVGDGVSGSFAFSAVLLALMKRDQLGHGEHIDISMTAALHAINACQVAANSINPDAADNFTTAPYGYFPTSDGYIAVAANIDSQWERVAKAIDQPQLARDVRYDTSDKRNEHKAEVEGILSAWTGARTSKEAIEALDDHDVPCGIVQTSRTMAADRDLDRLGLYVTLDDGDGGTIRVPADPMGLPIARPIIPGLGEHTSMVLHELLGLSHESISALAANGAFGEHENGR